MSNETWYDNDNDNESSMHITVGNSAVSKLSIAVQLFHAIHLILQSAHSTAHYIACCLLLSFRKFLTQLVRLLSDFFDYHGFACSGCRVL